jgi:cell division septation protein DedD
VNDLVTVVAAKYVESPGCAADIEHVPTARIVTVDPLTVHTAVVEEVRETTKPESEDGAKVTALSPNIAVEG